MPVPYRFIATIYYNNAVNVIGQDDMLIQFHVFKMWRGGSRKWTATASTNR